MTKHGRRCRQLNLCDYQLSVQVQNMQFCVNSLLRGINLRGLCNIFMQFKHWMVNLKFRLYLCTSGLPGQRPVTPRACGAWRRSVHPLHRAPRDRHCCPTRAGPIPFVKIAPQHRPARVARTASAVAPVPFLNRMTFSKSAILHRFPKFTH